MKVTAITVVTGALRTVPKGLVDNWRKNQDHLNYGSAEIS